MSAKFGKKTVESAHVLSKQGAHEVIKQRLKLAAAAAFKGLSRGFERFFFNLLDGKAKVWQTLAHAVEDVAEVTQSLVSRKV